jgi:hypothetical protein
MKNPPMTFPELYARWASVMLAGWLPQAPAKDLTPKAAQAAANEKWEDEGGSVTRLKVVPKIPL